MMESVKGFQILSYPQDMKMVLLETRHEVAGLRVKRTLFVPVENKGFICHKYLSVQGHYSDRNNIHLRELGLKKLKPKIERKIRVNFIIDGNITSYGLANFPK